MEKGLIPLTDDVLKLIRAMKVKVGAKCVLLRRRFGKTLADASKGTGFHQHRLSEMERGLRRVDPLYAKWIVKQIEANR